MEIKVKRTRNLYLATTVLVGAFSAIYEYFSHQVYSYYMIFAFAIPFLMGVIPYFIMGYVYKRYLPGQIARTVYNSGVVTMTVGCMFAGMLEIYGTTNKLLIVYPAIGLSLIVTGVIVFIKEVVGRFQIRTVVETC